MKQILKLLAPIADLILAPFTLCSAILLKLIRKAGVVRMPMSKAIFNAVGVFPIRNHYYEPLFNPNHLNHSLRDDRQLPGIRFNDAGQLALLERFQFNHELEKFPLKKKNDLDFFYHNQAFESGDAEFLYNMIRFHKPKRVVEIGSGYSTLMANHAIKMNRSERSPCEHTCVEPFQMPWLEQLSEVKIIREKVEKLNKDIFLELEYNDVLFIDSSHMIRPQGDVLFEYLELLPILKPGVLVHIHDIFTPKDYLDEWVIKEVKFWNEQYLLEAFLSLNNDYKIIGALNYLKHHHPEKLVAKCPILKQEMAKREPGSFWIVRQ